MEPAVWVLGALLAVCGHWWAEASLTLEQEIQDKTAVRSQCWMTEEFTVASDCSICDPFQLKTNSECGVTGFIEQVKCTTIEKTVYKSCRSALMEKLVFWRFVASMIAAAVILTIVVVFRQRTLDRNALEKVRKQIESI
ncbi:JTB [Pelobates cultripes]|uniref:Protein JTB n=2 Tax=Pelobates cultripes TaxID=61616 RepID=A0AAD1THK8_PELCU|nr:JTB [Pelobates cultripes]